MASQFPPAPPVITDDGDTSWLQPQQFPAAPPPQSSGYWLPSIIGGILNAAKSGATIPGDVATGRASMADPATQQRVGDMVGLVTLGAGALPAEENALNMGIKAYHGSPQKNLTSIIANPPTRQFDNATSQLGSFFSPERSEAQRYAGDAGRVYHADLDLKNPYEMSPSEFLYFQDITRGPRDADGFRGPQLPSEQWAERQQALKAEAAQLKQQLQDAGHDGVIIRDTKGNIKELSSFNDVTPQHAQEGQFPQAPAY